MSCAAISQDNTPVSRDDAGETPTRDPKSHMPPCCRFDWVKISEESSPTSSANFESATERLMRELKEDAEAKGEKTP